jgi:hypothetical protein
MKELKLPWIKTRDGLKYGWYRTEMIGRIR